MGGSDHLQRFRRVCFPFSNTHCHQHNRGGIGYACIAEARSAETIADGAPRTPWLDFGERVRIEMFDRDGRSVFGAIDQAVASYTD